MKALILAAGEGNRLRPYTLEVPKCMVQLGGRSLLAWQVDTLRAGGIEDISIVTGYRGDVIAEAFPDLPRFENPRYASTNMVSTLFCAGEVLSGDEDVLICYGDILYQADAVRRLVSDDSDVGLAVQTRWRRLWEERMEDPLSDAETMILSPDGFVQDLGRRPKSYDEVQGQYMGLIRVCADKVAQLRAVYDGMDRAATYDGKDFDNMYMTTFIRHWIDSGWGVKAVLIDGGWLEVDSTEDLELYRDRWDRAELAELWRPDGERGAGKSR